jgi:hypothetical protein
MSYQGDRIERTEDLISPYAGYRVPIVGPVPVTKWDLVGDRGRADMERTPTRPPGEPVLTCPACHAPLPTEADFARHFVIPDLRYWNLGNCPHE